LRQCERERGQRGSIFLAASNNGNDDDGNDDDDDFNSKNDDKQGSSSRIKDNSNIPKKKKKKGKKKSTKWSFRRKNNRKNDNDVDVDVDEDDIEGPEETIINPKEELPSSEKGETGRQDDKTSTVSSSVFDTDETPSNESQQDQDQDVGDQEYVNEYDDGGWISFDELTMKEPNDETLEAVDQQIDNNDNLSIVTPNNNDADDAATKQQPIDETKKTKSKIVETEKSPRRFRFFGFWKRKKSTGVDDENNDDDTKKSLIALEKASDLIAGFPSPEAFGALEKASDLIAGSPPPGASGDSANVAGADDDDDDDASGAEKPKKKSSALRKAARTVTLLLAILLYPIIADEVGDHMVVGSSSSEPRPQSLKRSREHELVVPESDNDDQPIADTDNPIMEESGDALESEPGSSRGSDNNEAWKDKLPPLPKQRGFTMPTVSTNTGNSPNTNKNGPNYWLNDRRRMALSFISEVVEQVGPSVVRIDTESQVNKDRVGYNYNNNPLDSTFVQQGQGSGLIFSSEGFILTNAHVVEGATKVKVTLTDGRVYSCIVTGTDDIVDIAVLKIVPDGGPPITNLPVAELGDSDQLKVGKIVIAVGSPGGLDNTVTMGIVSGRERSSMMVGIPHKLVNYIQTDAAINPGNSGGPLIDVESGQVIGINAAIRAHMEGTSFAIPINRVRDIMHDLSNGKEIRHGYLGCQLTTCTPDWARENNAKADVNAPGDSSTANKIPEVYGALVHKIYGKSPVHLGGLKEQDIIQQIGSEPVKSASDASRLIDLALPGDNIPFTILRNGNAKIINVKPKDMSSTQREMQREKQRRLQDEKRRFQELGPFRSLLRD